MLHRAHLVEPLEQRAVAEVAYRMNDSVRQALDRIGRTEDAQFAPSGRRIALAGFAQQRILVLELSLHLTPGAASVTFDNFLEIESDAFAMPHGLVWLDDETLVVANRCGEVAIFAVPPPGAQSAIKIEPLRTFGAAEFVRSPGSVSAATVAPGIVELLVCNNYVHTISRHLLDRQANCESVANEILIKRGLEVPDGVAQSASGRWIAVSNHNSHAVFIYRNTGAVNRASMPDGVLRGMSYPHGIRFSPDETSIIVADAGTPFIHIFRSDVGEWFGERTATDKIRAMTDEAFERGHHNREEGGAKGIDLTRDGSLLIASCEERPLAIFDVRAILGGSNQSTSGQDASRSREAVLRYGAVSKAPVRDAIRLIVGDVRDWARLLRIRWAWRIMAPLWAARAKIKSHTAGRASAERRPDSE